MLALIERRARAAATGRASCGGGAVSALAFELAPALEASEPPEARGLARDEVRLMVAGRRSGEIVHARFRDLPAHLRPGDLLVINTSATLPAAVPAHARGDADRGALRDPRAPAAPASRPARGRAAQRADGACAARRGPRRRADPAARRRPGSSSLAPYAGSGRLWLARVGASASRSHRYLRRHGRPIRYGYVPGRWPLSAYQTAYATEPGQRGDAQRRAAVHRRADHPARRAGVLSPRSRCTPGCRRPSATSRPTPSSTRCRRRPPGWSTPSAAGAGG